MMLGQELATALQLLQRWVENPEGDNDLNIKDTEKLQVFAKKIRGALRDVWKDPPTDVFNIGYVCLTSFFMFSLIIYGISVPDHKRKLIGSIN